MTFEPDVHYVSPDGTRRVVDGAPRETLRLGRGKRRTIDLPNGGHWTIPDQFNLGAIGEKESPHKLDKLGWREHDGKPGASWATPKPGSLAFPPGEDFVPVP